MRGIKKSILICIIVLISILLSVFSAVLFIRRHQQELALQLEDKNGDSKELCLITDEMIEEYTEDYRIIKRHVSTKSKNPSGVKGVFEECDCEYIKTKTGMLSGVYICNAYLGDGNELEYTIDSKVLSGNLKIVITDEDNKILYEVPIDSKETVSFVTEKSKIYYVKFVGESAELDITLLRNVNN